MSFSNSSRLSSGRAIRLARILNADQPTILLPLDDALISGPSGLLVNPRDLLERVVGAGIDAVMGFHGTLCELPPTLRVGRILNLTASTLRVSHTRKIQVHTLDDAIRAGADAVAVHVNVTSRFESEMIGVLGRVISEAKRQEIPVLALMYPRSETAEGDENYDALKLTDPAQYAALVAHACRIGVEIGADILKTQFTGTPDTFRNVIKAANGVPVLVAGGELRGLWETVSFANLAVEAGAAGISFGRGFHQRSSVTESEVLVKILRKLLSGNITLDTAQQLCNDYGIAQR